MNLKFPFTLIFFSVWYFFFTSEMAKGPLSLFKIEERAFIYVLQKMRGSAGPISTGSWNTGISII